MKCDCANCPTHACYTRGVNCTGVPLEAVKEAYTEEELKLMQAAAYVEGTFYSNICRLQETAEFAKASTNSRHIKIAATLFRAAAPVKLKYEIRIYVDRK